MARVLSLKDLMNSQQQKKKKLKHFLWKAKRRPQGKIQQKPAASIMPVCFNNFTSASIKMILFLNNVYIFQKFLGISLTFQACFQDMSRTCFDSLFSFSALFWGSLSLHLRTYSFAKRLDHLKWKCLDPFFFNKNIGPTKVDIFESILPPFAKKLGQLRWKFLNPYSLLPKKNWPVKVDVFESIFF